VGRLDIRRAMRRGRVALLAVLALGLSGCLVSEGPLIAPGDAAFPLPDRASAERFTFGDDKKWAHQANDTAYRAGSGYVVTREDGDEMEMTLKHIAQNTFIAQVKNGDGGYMYGLLVFQGNTIYEYAPDCEDFTEVEKQRFGLVKKDDDCTVTSVQGLADAYLAQLQKGIHAGTSYVLR
jgi:hypothetical protein